MDIQKSFTGYALGSYCFFRDYPVKAVQAFRINHEYNVMIQNAFTKWLNGNANSSIENIINSDGIQVTSSSSGPTFTTTNAQKQYYRLLKKYNKNRCLFHV